MDTLGYAYVVGWTRSSDFPRIGYFGPQQSDSDRAFLTKVNTTGTAFVYSSDFGAYHIYAGVGIDIAFSVATDKNKVGDVVLTGATNGSLSSFQTTPNAPQIYPGGGSWEAFVMKVSDTPPASAATNAPQANEIRCGGSPSQIPTTLSSGDTVNTATGYFCHSALDLAIAGRGPGLMLSRTYNSDLAARNGPLGFGWTHNYNMVIERDASNNYLVYEENGNVATFTSTFGRSPRLLATLTFASATGEYTFTRMHGQMRYIFKQVGSGGTAAIKLIKIIDPNNYVTLLTYDGKGRLLTVTEQVNLLNPTDPANRKLSFVYATTSTTLVDYVLESIPAHNGFTHTNRKVDFAQNAAGDLQSVIDVAGHLTEYTYDGTSHRVKTVVETRNGTRTTTINNVYDASGRVTTQSYPMGRSVQFGYNGSLSKATTRITDTLSLLTTHDYIYNKITEVARHPDSQFENRIRWRYTYEPGSTWVASVTDPLKHITSYTWDDRGNLRSETDALNNKTTYTYTTLNDPDIVTNAEGFWTDYNYDAKGNLMQVKRKQEETGQLLTVVYNQDPNRPGDVASIEDQRRHLWKFTYDTYGYPDLNKNPAPFESEATNYDYDGAGRLRRVYDAKGNPPTRYEYNARDQVLSVTNPLNHTTSYRYDAIGNVQYVTDAISRTITNTYNLNNELEQVTLPDGTYTKTTFDAFGRAKTLRNPAGDITIYDYFDLDRELKVSYPVTGTVTRVVSYKYDLARRLDSFVDANSTPRTTDYVYDDADRLTNINYSHDATQNVTLTYNDRGLRKTMKDGTGTTTYGYDSLDRLEVVQHTKGSRVDYVYDTAGNITDITYPANVDTIRRTVSRTFDEAGRMKTVADFSGGVTTLGYDANSSLSSVLYPGGASSTIIPDAAGRLISMTHTLPTGPFFRLDYRDRDKIGQLKTSVVMQYGQPDVTTSYSYDSLNRLTSSNSVSSASTHLSIYDLDAASQITRTTSYPIPGSRTYTDRAYNDANELYSLVERTDAEITSSLSFQYSPTGNRTQKLNASTNTTLATYDYDQANRLTRFTNHQTGAVSQYTYNGDGLRMTKPNQSIGTLEMTWDVAQGLPLLLYDGYSSYIYGPGGMLLAQAVEVTAPSFPSAPATDPGMQPSSSSATSAEPLEHRYYLSDQLGNVIAQFDPVQGAVLNTYSYDAYGRRECTLCMSGYNPFGYAGQYTDEESGLVYMRARYYDPETQQFISRDPLVGVSGQPYVYAGGNPVNATDPTGRFLETIADGVAIGMDWHDIEQEGLNWGNGIALGLDVVGAAIPFVPSVVGHVRRAGKALSHADGVGGAANIIGSGKAYSVAFETRLASSAYPGVSRKQHFQMANENLLRSLDADPQFAAGMEALIPGLRQQLIGPKGGISRSAPEHWTWHHAREAGVMQLVPRIQHQAPGRLQGLFHPGGNGGYSIWGK